MRRSLVRFPTPNAPEAGGKPSLGRLTHPPSRVLVDAAAMLRQGEDMVATSKARSERDAVADIAQMLERRARILDEIREALEELQAEVAGRKRNPCCSKGCPKCTRV